MTRWLRHVLAPSVERRFPAATLAAIAAAIARGEARHTGQVCFAVESRLPWRALWRGDDARTRAESVFSRLRVWDTAANNGVLVYLLLAEHAIEIVADRGLNRRVSAAQWQAIVDGLRQSLRDGRFEEGLVEAIRAVEALLAEHFPPEAGAVPRNELPDAVVVL